MLRFARKLIPAEDRGPLRVMFLLTSMPVGGAETLLVNLIRRLDHDRFTPVLCCLKAPGPLGQEMSAEMTVFHDIIKHKYDFGVMHRLARLFREERVDAVVTVGAGDKMFWGRLAARRAGVPVVLCALHSTGWPDAIGWLNGSRLLTRWTDGFIGVAEAHGRHLIDAERFPAAKVHVIPNGIDTQRFHPQRDGSTVRKQLGLKASTPVAGIVAALRPEKNHELFLRAAARVKVRIPHAHFLIVGDGPQRPKLESIAAQLKLNEAVRFLGTRSDIPELLAALDVFVLTSKIEANPVSILEAMATSKPVVAPRVGSIAESVADGQTGFLTEAENEQQVARRVAQLFADPELARRFGQAGRDAVVNRWALERMVEGYQRLIADTYARKCAAQRGPGLAAARAEPQAGPAQISP